MKSYLKNLSGLILIAMTLTACDLFDKVDDITFEGVLPIDFVINEDGESETPVIYSKTEILNALDDDEIEKYKNKITEIRLTKITYAIEGFVAPGDVTFTSGSLKVGPSGTTLATATSINLQDTQETEFTSLDQAGINDFANQIKDDKQVQIDMEGTLSNTPVSFTLKTYFHVTIKAEALK